MLTLKVPAAEMWNEYTDEFITTKETALQLEHSLVSISKWESKWGKAFLTKQPKTYEENLDYIKCMTLTQNVDPQVYNALTKENYQTITKYIENPMSATRFTTQNSGKGSNEQITSELIYYWMIALTIPFECQKWNLNRLLTLVRICNIKNKPPKKRSAGEIMSENAALNAARRQALGTKG